MKIVKLTKEYEDRYTDFIESHSKALIYYQLKYRDLLKQLLDCEEEYYVLLENEEVEAVMPMLYKDGKYGRVYNLLPYFGSNGAILANSEFYYEKLIEKYNDVVKDAAASTYIENPLDIHDVKPEHDFISERVCLFNLLESIVDEEALMGSFDSVRRRNVRKAVKENVTIEVDNSDHAIEFLHKVHDENMSAIGGKIKTLAFFNKIKGCFTEGVDFNIYVAKHDKESIGALLVFYFNNIVEYYTPVIVEEYRNKQPLALLIFNAMKDAVNNEFKYFNWGGNGIGLNSVYDFKKKWGAKDYYYNYYVKINNEDLLFSEPEELSKDYDNFFVVPFSELKKKA